MTGRSTGFWPARSFYRSFFLFFLQKVFVHCLMYLMKNFQNEGMVEVLKFVTLDGGLRKKTQKNFCVFCKNEWSFRPFLVTFRFERLVLSSAKRTQNKYKKHRRAQAKLLDVLSHDIMRKAKKWSYNFLAISDRLFTICRAANTKLFFGSAAFAVTKR